MSMSIVEACGVVAKQKGESVVVATMLSMFIFDRIEGADGQAKGIPLVAGLAGVALGLGVAKAKRLFSSAHEEAAQGSHQQRINSVPLMGGAAGLGLGIALARPDKTVVVMDGDASLLMELGGLATVAAHRPANFLHCVVHNRTQFTALDNMPILDGHFDFAAAARAAGYARAERIEQGPEWARRFPELLKLQGPSFVELIVDPLPRQTKAGFEQEELPPNQFTRMRDEAVALQRWLAGSLTASPSNTEA